MGGQKRAKLSPSGYWMTPNLVDSMVSFNFEQVFALVIAVKTHLVVVLSFSMYARLRIPIQNTFRPTCLTNCTWIDDLKSTK